MGNANKMLLLAAGVIITLFVIFAGFSIYNSSKGTVENANEEAIKLGIMLDEAPYTDYEGREILGNEVQSFITKNANTDIAIKVITNTNSSGTMYNYSSIDMSSEPIDTQTNNTAIANSKKKNDPTYINPNGKFACELNRNANDVITAIIFTQQ